MRSRPARTSFVHETESQLILNGSYNINCEFGVPLDLAGATHEAFIRARDAYGGQAWSTMVVKLLEDRLGTELRAPRFPAELNGERA